MSKLNEKNESEKQLRDICEFIRLSMIVEGTVEFHSNDSKHLNGELYNGMIFECNDRKRGIFFIAWYNK